MEFLITPEWVAGLRRVMEAWDKRVGDAPYFWNDETGERCPWDWPDMTPPLKYADSEAELVRIQLRQTRIRLIVRLFRDQEGDDDERAPV